MLFVDKNFEYFVEGQKRMKIKFSLIIGEKSVVSY